MESRDRSVRNAYDFPTKRGSSHSSIEEEEEEETRRNRIPIVSHKKLEFLVEIHLFLLFFADSS